MRKTTAIAKHTVSEEALKQLDRALERVWQIIGPDLYECAESMGDEMDNADAVSACTEHLSMYGDDPQAVLTFRQLIAELNYSDAVRLVTRRNDFA